jgi:type IV secretion system protein VirB10
LLTLTGGVAQFVASLGQNQNASTNQQFAFDPVTGQLVPIAGTGNSVLLSARQIGAQAAAQSITRMAEEALKDEIHIPPTIYVDQGTRVLIFVKRDLDFSDLYADPVKEALYELKHPSKRPRRDEDTALGDPANFLPERGGAHTGLVTKP